MKIIQRLFLAFAIFTLGFWVVGANWWPTENSESYLCQWDECSFEWWTDIAATAIDGIVTDKTFSEYVIQLIQVLTTYITLIWVIIIIYAGFIILVSGWEEEKIKNAKRLILYAILWIVLIWVALQLTEFIIDILDGTIQAPDSAAAWQTTTP